MGERLALFLPTKKQSPLILMHRGETDACIKKRMGAKLHREKKLCVPPKYHLQIHFKRTVVARRVPQANQNNRSLREDAPGGQLARQNIKVVTVTQTYLQCSCGESLYPPFPLEFL